MPDIYELAEAKADAIELELRRMNRWRQDPLPSDRFENMGAFGSNTMVFEQWIQFILIPRIKAIVSEKGEFPSKSNLATYAVRTFDGDDLTDKLRRLLLELDELIEAKDIATPTVFAPITAERFDNNRIERVSIGSDEIPPALSVINSVLHQFQGDDLESQLQTYDTFLEILSPAAREVISEMLMHAASFATVEATRVRIEKAATDVVNGRRAALPYDHAAAMKRYMDEHQKNYPK